MLQDGQRRRSNCCPRYPAEWLEMPVEARASVTGGGAEAPSSRCGANWWARTTFGERQWSSIHCCRPLPKPPIRVSP
jgi:hypothetical protein